MTSALLAPSLAQAQSAPAPAPESPPHTVLLANKALIAAGAAVFAPFYLASSLAAADGYDSPDGSSNARGALWIPAVGPFIVLGHAASALAGFALVLDGLGQVAGLTMLVYGIGTPKTVIAPDPATQPGSTRSKLEVVPLVGGGVSGAAVAGSF